MKYQIIKIFERAHFYFEFPGILKINIYQSLFTVHCQYNQNVSLNHRKTIDWKYLKSASNWNFVQRFFSYEFCHIFKCISNICVYLLCDIMPNLSMAIILTKKSDSECNGYPMFFVYFYFFFGYTYAINRSTCVHKINVSKSSCKHFNILLMRLCWFCVVDIFFVSFLQFADWSEWIKNLQLFAFWILVEWFIFFHIFHSISIFYFYILFLVKKVPGKRIGLK